MTRNEFVQAVRNTKNYSQLHKLLKQSPKLVVFLNQALGLAWDESNEEYDEIFVNTNGHTHVVDMDPGRISIDYDLYPLWQLKDDLKNVLNDLKDKNSFPLYDVSTGKPLIHSASEIFKSVHA